MENYEDYLKQVGSIAGEKPQNPLQDLYKFNKELLQFFNGINSQCENYLKSENENDFRSIQAVLIKLYESVPTLSRLKYHISTFDFEGIDEEFSSKIKKHFDYIQKEMLISEVNVVFEELYQLTGNMERYYMLELKFKYEYREKLRKDFLSKTDWASGVIRLSYYDHIKEIEGIK